MLKVVNLPNLRVFALARATAIRRFSDKKDDDSSDKPAQPKTASSRLNDLLAQMSTEDKITLTSQVKIPKPTRQLKRKKVESDSSSSSSSDDEKPRNISDAAKKVAASFGGDPKETEMELLSKLLGGSTQKANLTEVIAGMKVAHEQKERQPTRSDYVRNMDARPHRQRTFNQQTPIVSVDLYGAEPLGIFTENLTGLDALDTWRHLEEREMRIAVTHPPSNYFEKMALWTDQGKLWKFPIDNEQDIGAEAESDFTEHIFLEELLAPWCPPKGPVRHFMELVTVGLSKNPYMTVKEKHEHINYYKDYFESKKELLQQIIDDSKEAQRAKDAEKQVSE